MDSYSIIIPVYNVERYLLKCVNSVLNQIAERDVEVLLIDDGSTDNSGYMCDELANGDSHIRVFHQQNSGLSAARNTGIRCAKKKWIMFLDSDDSFCDHVFQRIELEMARYPERPLYIGTYLQYNEADSTIEKPRHANVFREGDYRTTNMKKALIRLNNNVGWSVWKTIVDRKLIIDNNLFFLDYVRNNEDTYWMTKLLYTVKSACYICTPIVQYRLNREESLSNNYINRARSTIIIYNAIQKEIGMVDEKNGRYLASCFGYLFLTEVAYGATLIPDDQIQDLTSLTHDNYSLIRATGMPFANPKRIILKYMMLILGIPCTLRLVRWLRKQC